MATVASSQHAVPSKRHANTNGTGDSPKQKRHYHHKHGIRSKQYLNDDPSLAAPGTESYEEQLKRAASLIFKVVGFESAEPEALQSVLELTDEFMIHFLASVRRSMLSSRRTQPVPQDFLVALSDKQLTLRSLIPHLDPPVARSSTQPSLSLERRSEDDSIQQAQLIDRLLAENAMSQSYVPNTFPALPSRHTFKADAAFRPLTVDPKQIREQATVEGRLGEEALRRLMSKKASDDAILLEGAVANSKKSARQRARYLWKETFERALQSNQTSEGQPMQLDPLGGPEDPENKVSPHVGPAVNADSIYWRKPITRRIAQSSAADG